MPQPGISVIIPARNESEHIERCLLALARQKNTPSFEVVVVDNASTDDTSGLVRQFAARHPELPLRLLSEPKPGRGGARAKGFAAARGQLLLSTDADTVVPEHWVAGLAHALSSKNCVAVTGSCVVVDCRPRTNFAINNSMRLGMRSYRIIVGHWWLTGSNFGIKRSAYEQAGGFDPAIRDQEDLELSWRVQHVGRIRFLPARLSVTTAGDRFQRGTLHGLWPYVRTYIGRFVLRQGDRYARQD